MGEAKRRRDAGLGPKRPKPDVLVGTLDDIEEMKKSGGPVIIDLSSRGTTPTLSEVSQADENLRGGNQHPDLRSYLASLGVEPVGELLVSGFMPMSFRPIAAGSLTTLMALRITVKPYLIFTPVIFEVPYSSSVDLMKMFDTDGFGVVGRLQYVAGITGIRGTIRKNSDAVQYFLSNRLRSAYLMPDWDVETMNFIAQRNGVKYT